MKKGRVFYRLEHIHHTSGDRLELYIGTYGSLELIKEAILKLKDKPGFKEFSLNSFSVNKIVVNQTYWEHGFTSLIENIDVER